ncbi:hypothetical protein WN944_003643 [Citrus x changshan-huyou]|uniref:MULE transposase domain-containing protein n=1 Tax=Citrus x changshan-huyou TaxID=2935761 RepID=A0AAP0LYY5_9ROSI
MGLLRVASGFVGIDGCHLKEPYGGIMLSVVSLYANSDVFPIVVCICEMKSSKTWKWFLSILREWLEIEDDILVTFMTNRQKSLLASLAEFWPRSTVRYCARHLFANVRSKWPEQVFRTLFWSDML